MASEFPIYSSLASGGVPIAFNIASSLQSAVKLAGTHACKAHFWACTVKSDFLAATPPLVSRRRVFQRFFDLKK